ncbi:hypothetical protein [Tenggerimyces flavus]|uniref:DUF3137 domain-containing protein n=1 Tax=Tenggerimyces flavus TaxID=1708749 RepID=A0ABV7Y9D7_9ACTN|nr:hypothetical protein [Tenggerimyces flavus]MBM7785702.1 hypothetical protein [Tenggerimyces flavus]
MEIVLVGGVVLILIVVGLVLAIMVPLLNRARRREELWASTVASWASAQGFTAYPEGTPVRWTERLPGTRAVGVRFLFAGQRAGRTVGLAEYEYHVTTQSGTSTHRFLVCVVSVEGTYPPIEVVERSGGSQLWRWLTGPADTEIGVAEFDERYRIATESPEVARQLVGPALVAAHVAGSVPPWSLYGSDLLAYWPGRLDPATALPSLDAVLQVAELLGK